MQASGRFRYVTEIALHSEEQGGNERVGAIAWTMGPVAKRLADGDITEDGIGLSGLGAVAERVLGNRVVPLGLQLPRPIGVR